MLLVFTKYLTEQIVRTQIRNMTVMSNSKVFDRMMQNEKLHDTDDEKEREGPGGIVTPGSDVIESGFCHRVTFFIIT